MRPAAFEELRWIFDAPDFVVVVEADEDLDSHPHLSVVTRVLADQVGLVFRVEAMSYGYRAWTPDGHSVGDVEEWLDQIAEALAQALALVHACEIRLELWLIPELPCPGRAIHEPNAMVVIAVAASQP